MSEPQTSMPDTVECVRCAEPISSKAHKCKHCGGFQDFRRFFDFSNIALSLLVAIISVSTVFIDRIPSLLKEINSGGINLGVLSNVTNASMEEITIIYMNNGNKVVWISEGAMCHTVSVSDPSTLLTGDTKFVRPPKESEVTGAYLIDYVGDSAARGFFLEPNKTTEKIYKFKLIMQNNISFDSNSSKEIRRGCFFSVQSSGGEEGSVVIPLDSISSYNLIKGVSPIDTSTMIEKAEGLWYEKNSDIDLP